MIKQESPLLEDLALKGDLCSKNWRGGINGRPKLSYFGHTVAMLGRCLAGGGGPWAEEMTV